MQTVVHIDNLAPAITPEGAERRVLAFGGQLMAIEFRFEAGIKAPMHKHPHEQIGYVVEGELDFLMEGQDPIRLKKGDSYYVPPETLHGVVIHSKTTLLDCFTPLREDFLQ
ncbi:MAG: cupin domain-containing protein [Trueperaceae bacterium]|nr:cupin domain-containing protein [Trueperaceae bacterium]